MNYKTECFIKATQTAALLESDVREAHKHSGTVAEIVMLGILEDVVNSNPRRAIPLVHGGLAPPPWFSTYAFSVSKVTPPVDAIKKPALHTVRLCLAQKNDPNLSSNVPAVLDLSLPISSERHTVGGVSNRKCK